MCVNAKGAMLMWSASEELSLICNAKWEEFGAILDDTMSCDEENLSTELELITSTWQVHSAVSAKSTSEP